MVIVIAARSDLRDGNQMANEAFADSPIQVRTVQPSEADYAAISEALMETARGRWFLAEYARRNRNADTRLVLDKVARLEESLAARQQADAASDAGPAVTEAVATIRDIVEAAQACDRKPADSFGTKPVEPPDVDWLRDRCSQRRSVRTAWADETSPRWRIQQPGDGPGFDVIPEVVGPGPDESRRDRRGRAGRPNGRVVSDALPACRVRSMPTPRTTGDCRSS